MTNQGTLTGETAESHSSPFAAEEPEETGDPPDFRPSGPNRTLGDYQTHDNQTSLAGFED